MTHWHSSIPEKWNRKPYSCENLKTCKEVFCLWTMILDADMYKGSGFPSDE
jgi:hypothetical protein